MVVSLALVSRLSRSLRGNYYSAASIVGTENSYRLQLSCKEEKENALRLDRRTHLYIIHHLWNTCDRKECSENKNRDGIRIRNKRTDREREREVTRTRVEDSFKHSVTRLHGDSAKSRRLWFHSFEFQNILNFFFLFLPLLLKRARVSRNRKISKLSKRWSLFFFRVSDWPSRWRAAVACDTSRYDHLSICHREARARALCIVPVIEKYFVRSRARERVTPRKRR